MLDNLLRVPEHTESPTLKTLKSEIGGMKLTKTLIGTYNRKKFTEKIIYTYISRNSGYC